MGGASHALRIFFFSFSVCLVAADAIPPIHTLLARSHASNLFTTTPHSPRSPTRPSQVHAPVNRHLSVWAGGSVLASTQHFNGHWISRDEFEAYGSELLHATR